jgi:hypothetical protein
MMIVGSGSKNRSNGRIQRIGTGNVNASGRSHPSPSDYEFQVDSFVGLEKLYAAAGLYIRAMGKKKEGEDREKNLPPEILGQAMISHGGEFAPESAYGQALLRLGSGMERMSRFQEVPLSRMFRADIGVRS